jgi:hypothetical protein
MTNNVMSVDILAVKAVSSSSEGGLSRGRLTWFATDGLLRVTTSTGAECLCDWLETGAPLTPPLALGDAVLFVLTGDAGRGIVMGRIGVYRPDQLPRTLELGASESLTLKCGEASIDLCADGKVMVRGEDVLLRAKGTQRIRAGTVSIN